ncbi:hypothetical protein [Amycolatopsis nigrescens]|uniref:hypothetical protein n=1 Tax=Amycolatopsis nigrescens TaxID=381445 RepID=UPI0003610080|nr:hypothetical protein [Amycolatopsis nigrescens]
MIAILRYQLALLGHSQRFLPPSLAYLLVLALLFNERDAPAEPEFAVSAGALTVFACWLTIALVDAEDPVQRLITLSHARRWPKLLGGTVLTVFGCCLVLTALTGLWSVLTHGGGTPGTLTVGALAHLACAGTGIAIGLPCSRLLIRRLGWTVLAALAALAVVVLVRWVPLVNPMLRSLTEPGSTVVPVLLGLLASFLALAASFAAVHTRVRRT